jgi:DNA adenine methylase
MRAPLRLLGGKGKLTPSLLPLIPHHATYVEVFGGGAALMFGKDPLRSKVEVYNDVDAGLVNFFRVLKNPIQFEKFVKRVQVTPYSRKEWEDAMASWRETEDPAEQAAMWFTIARQSFGGRFGGSWGFSTESASKTKKFVGYMPQNVLAWLTAIDGLAEFHWRMSRVQIESSDWRKCLRLYNARQTFVYLDPPYIWSTRSGGTYEHEMTDDDHKEMVEVLLSYKGMVMLSGYPHPIYEPLEEAGWVRSEFEVQVDVAGMVRSSQRTKGKGGKSSKDMKRTDTIWRNPACVKATPKDSSE